MRSIKELLEILLKYSYAQKQSDLGYIIGHTTRSSMCALIGMLDIENHISDEEAKQLYLYLKSHPAKTKKVKEAKIHAEKTHKSAMLNHINYFWWNKYNWKPRRAWLRRQIKKLES